MDTDQFTAYNSRYDYNFLRIGWLSELFSWSNCDNFAMVSLLLSLICLYISYKILKLRSIFLGIETVYMGWRWLFLRGTYRSYSYGGITWDTELIFYDALNIGLRLYLLLWLLGLNIYYHIVWLLLFAIFYYYKALYLEWQLFVCF
ncbi:MAG: hypothetical protein MUE85_17440 [Microscillaceae bacterium]|jgi:hypothetical protein|nr:hypothetical protein [Microscillaceae bacterium]